MTALVVDASAIVELLLATPLGQAVAVEVAANETLHAPDLIGVELVSVLRRLIRIGDIDSNEAHAALSDFTGLGVELYEHMPLLSRALELREAVTAYDAVYLALAEGIGAPVLTCDAKLAGSNGHAAAIRLVSADPR